MGTQTTNLYAEIVMYDGHKQISTAQKQGKSDLSDNIWIHAADYPPGTVISIRSPAPSPDDFGSK